ncbi:MAG TPA: hypothetical protein H9755_11705 [Candidatus Dietzia intestinigallinarum]|nr:hypothetical protein [Candidatus Dietzia intestinigallinarum]
MTTTSQQSPAGEPGPEGRSGGRGPADGSRRSGGRPGRSAGRGGGAVGVVVVVVVVVLVAGLGWLFLAGPASSSGRAERAVEQTLRDMSSAESFAEFNSHLCAENRVPQDLVDTITASGEQMGTDMDSMLRESIAGSFPDDLQVTGVEVSGDGAEATATVESGEDSNTEQVRMRDEDGQWKLCEPGVGMGSVPQEGRSG